MTTEIARALDILGLAFIVSGIAMLAISFGHYLAR